MVGLDFLKLIFFVFFAVKGAHHSSYRDLDRDEGHALHSHIFEEQVDWYEPSGEFFCGAHLLMA